MTDSDVADRLTGQPGTHVLLLRHAQSAWNAEGRWQGQADPELSPSGRAAAVRAGTILTPIRSIVASDLVRARDTARLISQTWTDASVAWLTPLLRERTVGPWEGLTREQIEASWPGYLDRRERPPGFENDDSVLRRLRRALALVEREVAGERVLCVTHGGLIHALETWAGLPRTRLENLGGRWVAVHGGTLVLGPRELRAV